MVSNALQRRWPDDADGDVFRGLNEDGFDFGTKTGIDFSIDFDSWPPSPALLTTLRQQFSEVKVYDPDDDGSGYVLINLDALLTYDLVMSMQNSLTALAAPYGGVCHSWGVMHG